MQINRCYETYKEVSCFRGQLFDLSESVKLYWNMMNQKEYEVEAVHETYMDIMARSETIAGQFQELTARHGNINGVAS